MASRGREYFQKYKPIILGLATIIKILPHFVRVKLFEHFRKTKGKKGLLIRYVLLKTIAKSCGDNVSIHPDVYLFSVNCLTLGSNVSIHPMCYIDATGCVEIGDDVSIASSTTILSTTHTFDNREIPIKDQPVEKEKTTIESNVWVGTKAIILCGKTVHSGSVIAAGAIITHDVPANSVMAGVPAVCIKER